MRRYQFIIFFSIALMVYGSLNFYIGIRGWQALSGHLAWRSLYLGVFLFLAGAYIAGRLLERVWLSPLSNGLVWIGSFWLGAMLYFLLLILCFDIFRLLNAGLHFLPTDPAHYAGLKWLVLRLSTIVVGIVLIAGFINARTTRGKTLELKIPKKAGVAEYNLVMLSDVHLGTIIGKKHFQKAVTTINQLQPDAVVIVGDLVDEDLKSVITDGMGDLLRQIKTRRGILAVPGNHEYIGGVVQAEKYISRHGVRVLHDKIVNLPGDIQLIGRDDRTNARRKTLPELMRSLDNNNPILVLDHQPFHLAAVAAAGVDVQVSGHTHHGQLWSLNYLT